jgi:hypothetical protein
VHAEYLNSASAGRCPCPCLAHAPPQHVACVRAGALRRARRAAGGLLAYLHITLHHPSDEPAPPPAGASHAAASPLAVLRSLVLGGTLPAFPHLLAALPPLPSLHDAVSTSYHSSRSSSLQSALSALSARCAPTLSELSVASVALPTPRTAVLSFDALLRPLLGMRELEVLGVHVGRGVVLSGEDERQMAEAWPRMRELALETRVAGKAAPAPAVVSPEPELEQEREVKALGGPGPEKEPRAALGALDFNRAGAEQVVLSPA